MISISKVLLMWLLLFIIMANHFFMIIWVGPCAFFLLIYDALTQMENYFLRRVMKLSETLKP